MASQPDAKGHKQGTGIASLDMYLHEPPREAPWDPWTFDSVMDEMTQNFERVDINRKSARKYETKQ